MSAPDIECLLYPAAELLPAGWRSAAGTGPIRAFNPALLRDGAGWILAYRVVLADGRRRIATCRLDANLRVIAGTPFPLSDLVQFSDVAPYPEFARQWLADPRLYRWDGRIFVYWNSGWHEPRNIQFLQELNPVTLAPVGPPRELLLHGERRPLEKNWTFFEDADGTLHAVYSVEPHRVLRFSTSGEGSIGFDEVAYTAWSLPGYPPSHGGLRGGAPPVWHDGCFWSFCHSVHDGTDGYCYAAGVYCFSAGPRFAPLAGPMQILPLGRPYCRSRAYPRLNPAVDKVIYPCGAARDGTRWLVSHGINDEQCAISLVSDTEVRASLRPWTESSPLRA